MTIQIDYPFRIAGNGRTATTTDDEHVRDLVEQVLFTMHGERVNRVGFGSDITKMLFSPNGTAVVPAVQLAVQAALVQWLSDLIAVDAVEVRAVDSTMTVTVRYLVRRNQDRRVVELTRRA